MKVKIKNDKSIMIFLSPSFINIMPIEGSVKIAPAVAVEKTERLNSAYSAVLKYDSNNALLRIHLFVGRLFYVRDSEEYPGGLCRHGAPSFSKLVLSICYILRN